MITLATIIWVSLHISLKNYLPIWSWNWKKSILYFHTIDEEAKIIENPVSAWLRLHRNKDIAQENVHIQTLTDW